MSRQSLLRVIEDYKQGDKTFQQLKQSLDSYEKSVEDAYKGKYETHGKSESDKAHDRFMREWNGRNPI